MNLILFFCFENELILIYICLNGKHIYQILNLTRIGHCIALHGNGALVEEVLKVFLHLKGTACQKCKKVGPCEKCLCKIYIAWVKSVEEFMLKKIIQKKNMRLSPF